MQTACHFDHKRLQVVYSNAHLSAVDLAVTCFVSQTVFAVDLLMII